MTEEISYGTGAIPSPIDGRDWPIEMYYTSAGLILPDVSTLPTSYMAPTPFPPQLDQDNTPQCVAFESANQKCWEALHDPHEGSFVANTGAFFTAIGGTSAGAVPRDALNYMLNTGYIPVTGSASAHRIAAYFAVPLTVNDIKSAVAAVGPVALVTKWFNSWFHPVNGVLPAPTTLNSYHDIAIVGWNTTGFVLWNSWGSDWGANGYATLPYAYLPTGAIECWKAVDALNPAPTVKAWSLRVAAHANVHMAVLNSQRPPKILRYDTRLWGASPSSAPGNSLRTFRGIYSGQALCLYIVKGVFSGRWVRISPADGTSATPIV